MKVAFLWFDDCPNHEAARRLLVSVLESKQVEADIDDINASDPEDAQRLRFPGSPTIRIDGQDIEPGFVDPGDYALPSLSNELRTSRTATTRLDRAGH